MPLLRLVFTLSLLLLLAPAAHAGTVAAGSAQSCAILSGKLSCWGSDSTGGALGLGRDLNGDTADPLVPAGMDAGVTDVELMVSGGGSNTSGCAVKSGGAWCWGTNSAGQYGNGTRTSGLSPVQVSGLASGVSDVTLNTSNACAIHNGGAKCWGSGHAGRLGYGDTDDRLTPVVPEYRPAGDHTHPAPAGSTTPMTSGVTGVASGWRHTCAIWNSQIVCMGDNTNGQLGYGSYSYSTPYKYYARPIENPPPGTPVKLVAGSDMNCVLMDNGSLWCWGYDESGRLGDGGGKVDTHNPTQVVGMSSGVTDVSASSGHVCAVKNGEAWCWGDGQVGKLGNNPPSAHGNDAYAPVKVSNLTGVTAIAVGGGHTCALAGGERWCWGGNSDLQLGTDQVESWSGVPVKVTGSTPKPPAQPKPATPAPAAPAPPRPPVVVRPPAPLVATVTVSPRARLARRLATLALIACPARATCRLAAPSAVRVRIRRRAYRLPVLGAGVIRAGRAASLRLRFTSAAARRLGRRSVRVSLRITTTVNGVATPRTLSVLVSGR